MGNENPDIVEVEGNGARAAEIAERYRLLVDGSPYAIAIHQDGRLVFVNEAGLRLFGAQSPEQVIGRPIVDFVLPERREATGRRIARMLAGETGLYPTEEYCLRLDGGVVPVEMTAAPFTHNGRPAIQVLALDISDRKEAENALRASEERYRMLAENSPAIVYREEFAGNESRLLYVSPQAERLLGASRADLIHGTYNIWSHHLHPEDRPRVQAEYGRFIRQIEPFDCEYRMVSADGQVLWFHDRAIATRPDADDRSLVHGVMNDITERKRAEIALRRERDFSAQVLNTIGQGLTVVDGAGRFEYVNPAYARMIGYSPESLLGRTPAEFTVPEDWPALEQAGVDRRAGQTTSYETRLRHREGHAVPVLITGVPRQQDDAYSGSISVITDISERKQAELALRESEERFRLLAEQIPAIVYLEQLKGDDRRLAYISPQVIDLLGISAEKLFRRDYDIWDHHLHPDDAQGVRSRYRYCFTHRIPFEYEYRMIATDGRVLWVRDEAITTYDSESDSGLIHGVFYDVTQQKQVEASLNENVHFLSRLQEVSRALHASTNLDDLIHLIFDALQELFAVDRGMISLVHRERGTIEGYRAFGFSPDIVADTVRNLYSEAHPDEDILSITVRTGEPMVTYSERHPGSHMPTVEKYDIRGHIAQVPLHSRGNVIGVLGITRRQGTDMAHTPFTEADVERMFLLTNQAGIAIENALLRAQITRRITELTTVYESSRQLIQLHTPSSLAQTIIHILEEAIGQNYGAVLLLDEDSDTLLPFALSAQGRDEEFVARDKVYVRENAPRLGAGITGWVASTGQSVRIGDVRQDSRYHSLRSSIRSELCVPLLAGERVIGVLNVETEKLDAYTEADQRLLETLAAQIAVAVQNAHLLEQVQTHAAQLEQRVAARTAELAVAKDRAEAADRTKSVFLASMSHELRTPLNSVIGFTGVMQRGLAGPLTAEQERQLGIIHSSAHHLLALINDVLDISRIEAGQVELRMGTFAVDQLISAVLRTMSVSAEQKGLLLTAELGAGVGRIVSDERRVTQVLLNLVSNSIKFSEHGQIHITCYRRDEHIEISVSDEGIGIPESEIEVIFKPFHQTHSEMHKPQQGTGLGLSICKRLLDLLGGGICVESQVGKGSTFVFTLPLTGPGRMISPETAAAPATAVVPET